MLRQPTAKGEAKRRKIRFPGIVVCAQKLGVDRSHLFRVLTGERKSPPLMDRFNQLSQQGEA